MTPDPWNKQNPRLAHDCGLALDTARTAAADAAIKALSRPPVDGSAETPEHEKAEQLVGVVVEAFLSSLGEDEALAARGDLPAVTVTELAEAAKRGA